MTDKHYEVCLHLDIFVTQELIDHVEKNEILLDADVFEAILILKIKKIPDEIVCQALL